MKYLIIVLVCFLSACTTLSKDVRLVTDDSPTSEVLIYRTSAFQAWVVSMYLGEDDKYFVKLRNNQYSKFKINSGEHLFQAKADASPSSKLKINLPENTTVCLRALPNPQMLGAVAVPIVANMVPTFIIEKTECPSSEKLDGYRQVFSS